MIPQKNPLIASGESVHANMFFKLWENPTPSATFSSQTMNLSSSDYDFLLIPARAANGSNRDVSVIIAKGESGYLTFPYYSSGTLYSATRLLSYTDDTHIAAADATVAGGTVNNAYLIPIAIYGFKKSLDITAIVSNVSTDASKCMLSDGVTSVGDVIDGGSVSVTADGSKTWSQLLNSLYALINSSKLTAWSYISLSTGIIFPISSKGATQFDFGAMTIRNLNAMRVKSSSSEFTAFNIETKTYTDNSSSVATSGTVITLHY